MHPKLWAPFFPQHLQSVPKATWKPLAYDGHFLHMRPEFYINPVEELAMDLVRQSLVWYQPGGMWHQWDRSHSWVRERQVATMLLHMNLSHAAGLFSVADLCRSGLGNLSCLRTKHSAELVGACTLHLHCRRMRGSISHRQPTSMRTWRRCPEQRRQSCLTQWLVGGWHVTYRCPPPSPTLSPPPSQHVFSRVASENTEV